MSARSSDTTTIEDIREIAERLKLLDSQMQSSGRSPILGFGESPFRYAVHKLYVSRYLGDWEPWTEPPRSWSLWRRLRWWFEGWFPAWWTPLQRGHWNPCPHVYFGPSGEIYAHPVTLADVQAAVRTNPP